MEQKFKATKKAGLLGIFGNLFLLIIKGFIGFYTNSQSMIADAINSASDIIDIKVSVVSKQSFL